MQKCPSKGTWYVPSHKYVLEIFASEAFSWKPSENVELEP